MNANPILAKMEEHDMIKLMASDAHVKQDMPGKTVKKVKQQLIHYFLTICNYPPVNYQKKIN